MDFAGNHNTRPRATDVSGAVTYTGMSRSTLYEEMKAGRLKYVKIGNSTRLEYDELDRWFNQVAEPAA
ncbi:helix-turn-helix domain-containing protein [Ruegeria atlantica]|uniref:DNA binding domain, excisionase family n=1 Tax=Ruegeria atlantica TaxID=81569 RepID=A0A0P1E8J0_9RHOB|nr:DNA binding domain, excisionase family [Ruegeria atlantica]